MKIKFKEITVRELTKDYNDKDNEGGGVVGYGGKLDIRPPYQRNFIYKPPERNAVIDTLRKGFPLNVMYWAVRDDGNFEVIDGQQRTISISEYVVGEFSVNKIGFDNLQNNEQEQILNYKLMVYQCSGTDSEKLEWFKTINIAGKELTNQELRNAVYSGSWVTDAKRYFSKNGCVAFNLGHKYLDKRVDRQEYLESAIKWINNGDIEGYMSDNQHAKDAVELWKYFQEVIKWVKIVFPKYREEMQGVEWGFLYNQFKNKKLDSEKLEAEVAKLMRYESVDSKKGIYPYVLTGKEKHLNIRLFKKKQKREIYEEQNEICNICKKHFDIKQMEADHIIPWHLGGKTNADNCQMLCMDCNRTKGGK